MIQLLQKISFFFLILYFSHPPEASLWHGWFTLKMTSFSTRTMIQQNQTKKTSSRSVVFNFYISVKKKSIFILCKLFKFKYSYIFTKLFCSLHSRVGTDHLFLWSCRVALSKSSKILGRVGSCLVVFWSCFWSLFGRF